MYRHSSIIVQILDSNSKFIIQQYINTPKFLLSASMSHRFSACCYKMFINNEFMSWNLKHLKVYWVIGAHKIYCFKCREIRKKVQHNLFNSKLGWSYESWRWYAGRQILLIGCCKWATASHRRKNFATSDHKNPIFSAILHGRGKKL